VKPQTRLQLSDTHIPFEDPALLKVWLAMLKDVKPDGIDIIGDVLDCYVLSRFDKNPRRKEEVQTEADLARKFLEKMRAAAGDKCDIRYLEGNHENRLERLLWSSAKQFASIRNLSIPGLLGLDRPMIREDRSVAESLGIRYYDPKAPYKIGDLYFLHGDVTRKQNFSKSTGGTAAASVAKAIGGSVLMGHTHQLGYGSFRTWEKQLESYEIGCMCQFDMEYIVGVPPWTQAWSLVTFTRSGHHHCQLVRVLESDHGAKREIIFEGRVYARVGPSKKHYIRSDS
jgi:UDP-2,3-diacylglucosamine pyrophosphatase LpxH